MGTAWWERVNSRWFFAAIFVLSIPLAMIEHPHEFFRLAELIAGAVGLCLFIILPTFLRIAVPVLLILLAAQGVVQMVKGVRCPACGCWNLQCVHVASFGYRCFRCSDCGSQWKRVPLGSWIAVKDSDEAARYFRGKKVQTSPWDDELDLDHDEEVGDDAASILLRHRRGLAPRDATADEAVVLEPATPETLQGFQADPEAAAFETLAPVSHNPTTPDPSQSTGSHPPGPSA